jgi:hypothetical protein
VGPADVADDVAAAAAAAAGDVTTAPPPGLEGVDTAPLLLAKQAKVSKHLAALLTTAVLHQLKVMLGYAVVVSCPC